MLCDAPGKRKSRTRGTTGTRRIKLIYLEVKTSKHRNKIKLRLQAILYNLFVLKYHVVLRISKFFYTCLNNKRGATYIFYIMFYHIIVSSRYNHVDGDISSKSI